MIKKYTYKKTNYKSLLKVILPSLLFLVVLFSLFSISNNTKVITSLSKVFYGDNEVELDNWEISTIFYDSDVNDGKTPLTEINWEIPGDVTTTVNKTVKVQINYRNRNTVQNYKPGDLKITIPNIGYSSMYPNAGFETWYLKGVTVTGNVGANDSTHSGYDWNVTEGYSLNYSATLSFENNYAIEENTNFEGSIQIVYKFQSSWISPNEVIESDSRTYNMHYRATLNNTLNSNYLDFNYTREFIYNWEKSQYKLSINNNKISSYDRLGSNPDDYIWVKCSIMSYLSKSLSHTLQSYYPNLKVTDFDYKISFPDGTIVYNENGEQLNKIDSSFIINSKDTNLIYSNYYRNSNIYVGFPKEQYNSLLDENLPFTIDMYGTYETYENEELLTSYSGNIKLSNFLYSYSGEMYQLDKRASVYQSDDVYVDTSPNMIYQHIKDQNDRNFINWTNTINVRYSNSPMTVILGDDYMFRTDHNNVIEMGANDYYFSEIKIPRLVNSNGYEIENDRYKIHLFVRKFSENSFSEYDSFMNTNQEKKYTFNKDDKIADFYIKIDSLSEGLKDLSISSKMMFINKNVEESGTVYNYSYLKVLDSNNNLLNPASTDDYTDFNQKEFLLEADSSNGYLKRKEASVNWSYYEPYIGSMYSEPKKTTGTITQNGAEEQFEGSYTLSGVFEAWHTDRNLTMKQNVKDFYFDDLFFTDYELFDLLPEGNKLLSTKEDIINSITAGTYFYNREGDVAFNSYEEAKQFFKEHATIVIKNNWRNTGRTWVHIKFDFPDYPLVTEGGPNCYNSCGYMNYAGSISLQLKVAISYGDYAEFGNIYDNYVYSQTSANEMDRLYYDDNGQFDSAASDINENNRTDDKIHYAYSTLTINSVVSTHQDVQVSVQSDKSNYSTGKIDSSNNSEYTYKLRVRTGANEVTNLVVYDSLEKYAKDTNMEFVHASGGRGSWHGEFLGVDTSYAEGKGYVVKVYYSEDEEPGSLKTDNSWKVYNESVDKTRVKSLAFEYLDSEGRPAVLPVNSLTYVLIKMKSPSNENIKTFAYNGCWTEWNAIDSLTGNTVDFITGINSNIVKVALPNSVEPVDIDLTIDKYWKDNNNELGIRPDTITVQVIPDGDLSKAIDVPLGNTNIDNNNPNHWSTTISVPKYDLDGNTISYTLRENEIILDNGYKYTPEINDNSITNTLMKEIELKKIWKDNTNSYLTRPSNVTYKIKQNNTLYQEITFTGDYSINEWTKKITVPVYDSSNRTYNYTIEENQVDNYTSDCNNYTCTNILTGNDTLNIKKNWKDNNNSYNTRPNSIMVNVLQNNNVYRGLTLTDSNNWTTSVTVPKYDSNGVKYNYTIEEEQVDEYGLVEYNQNTYNITNTLQTNINLTITKNWVDDNNSYNTRPNELKITLLQNNNEYQELTLTGDTNTWTTSIEVPKYDNNQRKYTYSIREITDNLNSDYSDITYSEEELSVTNKLNKKQELLIKKKWIDQDNKYLTRPSKVSINVLRNGEVFTAVELTGNTNTWTTTINDVDVYDPNGKKYTYTLEEETLEKYEKVTYDNTNLEITNELTEIPKVTLYFTVVNGYVDPVTGEMKYDDFGLNEIMKKYNVNPDDEYIFKFELQNTSSGKVYEGKLSTKGILEFDDLPYGEYKAIEGEDKLFQFVDMIEIEEVNGVKFERRGKEGFITVEPTGNNIIYGAKIINKIEAPITNPKTNLKGLFVVLTIVIVAIISFIVVKKKKELYD